MYRVLKSAQVGSISWLIQGDEDRTVAFTAALVYNAAHKITNISPKLEQLLRNLVLVWNPEQGKVDRHFLGLNEQLVSNQDFSIPNWS